MRDMRTQTVRVRRLGPDDLAGLGDLVPESWMPQRIEEPEEPVPALDGWSWGGSARVADLQTEVFD